MKQKILLEGPFLTQSGYGEHARNILRLLKLHEDIFDIYATPVNWGRTSWVSEDTEERRWLDFIINKTVTYLSQRNQFDVFIHVGIPNELQKKAPVTIEVTAGIETDKCTPEWIDILNKQCDKIITISEHSKSVLENSSWQVQDQSGNSFELKLKTPVEIVAYPVKQFESFSDEKINSFLNLEYDFNFLCVSQWGTRKNIENTIRWFVEEFQKDKVGLVCKINLANNSNIDKIYCEKRIKDILDAYPDRQCKVYLLHGDMNNDEVHNIYIHPKVKAIINFGHGEGFGLPLFEAAYCGLPVITTDYSGQKDFLYMEVDGKKRRMFSSVPYELKKIQPEAVWNGVLHEESQWAFVKPIGAKLAMRECYKDYGRFKGQAKKLKKYLEENFSMQKIDEKFIQAFVGQKKYEWLKKLKGKVVYE